MKLPPNPAALRVLPSQNLATAGFSLLEMLITITIVAILLAVGVPSFKFVTASNRVTSEINGLLGDLQFARAEAIKQGLYVTLCPSTDGASCTVAGTNWQTGWLVFIDLNNSGTLDAGDTLLKVQAAFNGTDTLQPNHNAKRVTFSREGFAMNIPSNLTLTLHDATSTAQYTRCLSLSIVGATSTQVYGAQTVENVSCS